MYPITAASAASARKSTTPSSIGVNGKTGAANPAPAQPSSSSSLGFLLVWSPVGKPATRILVPGDLTQTKLFEGLMTPGLGANPLSM